MHGNNFCPRLRVQWRWIGNQANPASRLAGGRLASEPLLVTGTVGAEENPSLIPVFRHYSVEVFRVLHVEPFVYDISNLPAGRESAARPKLRIQGRIAGL